MIKTDNLYDWVYYKLIKAEGDQARIQAGDLVHSNPSIREIAIKLRPMSDEMRFKVLRKTLNRLRSYTSSPGPG